MSSPWTLSNGYHLPIIIARSASTVERRQPEQREIRPRHHRSQPVPIDDPRQQQNQADGHAGAQELADATRAAGRRRRGGIGLRRIGGRRGREVAANAFVHLMARALIRPPLSSRARASPEPPAQRRRGAERDASPGLRARRGMCWCSSCGATRRAQLHSPSDRWLRQATRRACTERSSAVAGAARWPT